MDDKFSLEKNHWQIQDPVWAGISHIWTKDIHWCCVNGISNSYLQSKTLGGRLEERFFVDWPSTARHMYFIWQGDFRGDYIFASYSLAEIKRFLQLASDTINKSYRKYDGVCNIYFVYDMPQKKWYEFKHDNLDVYYEVRYPLDEIKESANKIEV